jgi:hypothetical protein
MAEEKPRGDANEPRGLGEHNRAVTSTRAHEQGWGLNEEDREKAPEGRPDYYGGKGYDYGSAEDFGDTAVKMEEDQERGPEQKDRLKTV